VNRILHIVYRNFDNNPETLSELPRTVSLLQARQCLCSKHDSALFRCIVLCIAFMLIAASSVMALELPENLKEYFKDNVSSAIGSSEGVGPTEKPKVTEGVDIGRRETNEYDFSDESIVTLMQKAWQALNAKDQTATLVYTDRCIELYSEKARKEQVLLKDFAKL